ncbi:archaeosine tRNA-ribosyltransferase [Candidatus Methanoperedens nitroreducens]|uniref:tRNA-guanine(15) transglycosylase n=1 Tax=Candidatus Methanoperedens nitratireducens TaxID=1392998 RepID=A0A062UZL1_9EURY|nr:tRNA guanosine(15) transglycosylase TgtA [Candidatus Methanoperedens nitroreducens]KCZ72361.1 archaeosine tRNA-ribosyltransferase [Candidatus Methanoperedens nitroreducens]MDJ1423705.1 tRNA guanosine(15) transglycosylase TgtA [Candidatus Methanoperedens sp.]
MPQIFEIFHKDICGRIGRLETPHGTIETPTIMPVVNPNIQTIKPSEFREFGAEVIITNSYIIYRKPELRERALSGGLHSLLDFDGPIMTDSGSYQLSVYGQVEVNNTQIVQFQQEIGSDIGVPLDIPTPPDVPFTRAESELEITIERAEEALGLKKDMLLAAPVQGSTFSELRERAARRLSQAGFDVYFDIYPLGAVVPLMESYRYSDLVDVIVASKKGLPPSAPVHLFGAGHPMMFSLAVALGCDLFDSASYALYAKEGRYMTVRGTYHVDKLHYLPCSCPICTSHDAEELIKSENREELLARHNLYATFAEMREVKQAIKEGSLWELVEQRCRAHPRLLDGLKRALSYSEWVEQFEPISKSTFFYSGPESSLRPEVLRYRKKLKNLDLKGRVLIRAQRLDNEYDFDYVLDFKPPFGPYPLELKETYPFNAEVTDEPDYESLTVALQNMLELMELNPEAEFTFVYDGEHPLMEEIARRAKVIGKGREGAHMKV